MKPEQREPLLDSGFWRAVGVMAVISIVLMVGVVVFPIDKYFPEAATVSKPIDDLFKFCAFFGAPIFVFINGFLLYFAIRFRRRADEPIDAVGSEIHEHQGLELTWTVIPSLLMVVLAVLSYLVIPLYYPTNQAFASAVTLEAIGHKFYYEFRYPGLKQSVMNELHLPIGIPVTVDLTSAEDEQDVHNGAVIHSFWVPEFRLKQDMIPGIVIPIHFTPSELGTYRIVCSEFCGLGHSHMWGKVIVQSKAEFNAWYADQQRAAASPISAPLSLAGGNPSAGQTIFNAKCTVCHNAAPFAQRKVGPGLSQLFDDPDHPDLVTGKKATPDNVADIVEHGAHGDMGVMPNMQANGLSPKDVADLVAYLRTLR